MYYNEDRLKTPLIRVEERGKQVFADDLYFAENENVSFSTDSGKIELYSTISI